MVLNDNESETGLPAQPPAVHDTRGGRGRNVDESAGGGGGS
jgi:hypothetical protein